MAFTTEIISGLILGLGAALLLVGNGRIAGLSGILANLVKPADGQSNWRWMFIIGLLLGPALAGLFGSGLPSLPERPSALVTIAGLLVGFGAMIGSGCTSGHAICGIGRLSPRSIVATMVFMGCAGLTVFVTRHLLGA